MNELAWLSLPLSIGLAIFVCVSTSTLSSWCCLYLFEWVNLKGVVISFQQLVLASVSSQSTTVTQPYSYWSIWLIWSSQMVYFCHISANAFIMSQHTIFDLVAHLSFLFFFSFSFFFECCCFSSRISRNMGKRQGVNTEWPFRPLIVHNEESDSLCPLWPLSCAFNYIDGSCSLMTPRLTRCRIKFKGSSACCSVLRGQ